MRHLNGVGQFNWLISEWLNVRATCWCTRWWRTRQNNNNEPIWQFRGCRRLLISRQLEPEPKAPPKNEQNAISRNDTVQPHDSFLYHFSLKCKHNFKLRYCSRKITSFAMRNRLCSDTAIVERQRRKDLWCCVTVCVCMLCFSKN